MYCVGHYNEDAVLKGAVKYEPFVLKGAVKYDPFVLNHFTMYCTGGLECNK